MIPRSTKQMLLLPPHAAQARGVADRAASVPFPHWHSTQMRQKLQMQGRAWMLHGLCPGNTLFFPVYLSRRITRRKAQEQYEALFCKASSFYQQLSEDTIKPLRRRVFPYPSYTTLKDWSRQTPPSYRQLGSQDRCLGQGKRSLRRVYPRAQSQGLPAAPATVAVTGVTPARSSRHAAGTAAAPQEVQAADRVSYRSRIGTAHSLPPSMLRSSVATGPAPEERPQPPASTSSPFGGGGGVGYLPLHSGKLREGDPPLVKPKQQQPFWSRFHKIHTGGSHFHSCFVTWTLVVLSISCQKTGGILKFLQDRWLGSKEKKLITC